MLDTRFSNYKSHLGELHKLAPNPIQKKLEFTVNNFFTKITNQCDVIEKRFLDKLENSTNLRQLITLLMQHQMKLGVNSQAKKSFEEDYRVLDRDIKQGQYATVVMNKDKWDRIIDNIRNSTSTICTVEKSARDLASKIMKLKKISWVTEAEAEAPIGTIPLGKRVHSLIEDCLAIDKPLKP